MIFLQEVLTKRTEWLEQPSVETNTSTLSSVSRLTLQALSVKQEKEATTLKSGV